MAVPDLPVDLGPRPSLDVLADPERVAAVERLIAAGPSSRGVQRLTALAARLLRTPCAQVSLLGADEQRVASAVGVPYVGSEVGTPLEDSLCSVTAALYRPFVVEDAAGHPWVYDLPPVTSGAVSAYLGVILTDAAGHVLGSLCVYDSQPRAWRDEHCEILTAVADAVADDLEDVVAER